MGGGDGWGGGSSEGIMETTVLEQLKKKIMPKRKIYEIIYIYTMEYFSAI